MDRLVWRDLTLLEAVARHRSFTGAATELGMSQSSLSYAIAQLELRVGIALLARTTRSVSPTDAGRRLLRTLEPALHDLEQELASLQEMSSVVSGTVRLTMVPVAFDTILRPALFAFYEQHPHVTVEVSVYEGLSDIVSEGFDGGIRFGSLIEKDMVSLPLTEATSVSIVGSPSYFERFSAPETPEDLKSHRCIGYRFVTSTKLYRWPLAKGDKKIEFASMAGLILNDGEAMRSAAVDGLGLAYLFTSQVAGDIDEGRLVSVLSDWLPGLPGFSLYYPSRRRASPGLRALIEHLKKFHRARRA